jgi:5-methyltetrahydrofolate--homocysteine methyltransferase
MSDTKALTQAVVEMQEDKALEMTKELLDGGEDPIAVFDAYKAALEEIGQRFEKQIYFIPELIMSGEMMKAAVEIIKPHLGDTDTSGDSKKLGKMLIATVAGDIHDIGKNIVTMLMDINGFEVRDLGVDVPTDKIVNEAQEFGADIVGLSGLLTLAFDPMKDVVEGLAAAGLRDKVKVIIGGAQMDEQVCQHVGADAFVTDAVAGINICKGWMN